jgi:hypothetical protein
VKLKLFPDLIDAFGKVADGLKATVNLPRAKREEMHQVLDEAYRLMDTMLNLQRRLLSLAARVRNDR